MVRLLPDSRCRLSPAGRAILLAAPALLCFAATPPADPFNRALAEYRAGRFASAEALWTRRAPPARPDGIEVLARYNAGNAAFRAGRFPDAVRLYGDALDRLRRARRGDWPPDLTPARRGDLWRRFESDLLHNLELALQRRGPAPAPEQPGTTPAPAPAPPRPGTGPARPTPGAPGPAEPRPALGPVQPLSPSEARRLLRGVLARDVPPPPKPLPAPPGPPGPDW
jgi:hypothetical protein